jgi:ribosome-binding factor A
MPREFSRASRIADQIQRDLSGLIRQEVKDPRVGLVTITDVEVNRDLSHAKIYISALAEVAAIEQSVEALQHAAGFLRHELSRTLKIRSVPQLQFLYDESIERGVRLSHLIDQAVASDSQLGLEDDGSDR